MAQHTYDNEAVQELLNWAKKMIETKNYPTERYQPTLEQFWEFREKCENKEAQ